MVTVGYVYYMQQQQRLWSSELRRSRIFSVRKVQTVRLEVIDDNSSMTKILQTFMQEAREELLWLTMVLIRHIMHIRTDN